MWIDKRNREMYEDSFQSDMDYGVSIVTDTVLRNVTLYVPIPVYNNTSSVGQDIIDTNFNNDDTFWEYTLVDTEYGLMLSMKANKVNPPTSMYFSDDLSTHVTIDHVLDTKTPVGSEMLLSPMYELKHVDSGKYWYSDNVYTYEGRAYAEYEANQDANVEIYVSLDGRNSWWIWGWQSNDYAEEMDVQLTGPQDGWVDMYGEIVMGEGVYKEY